MCIVFSITLNEYDFHHSVFITLKRIQRKIQCVYCIKSDEYKKKTYHPSMIKWEKSSSPPLPIFFLYINRMKVLNTILSAIHRFSLRKIQSRFFFFFLLEYVLVDNTMELEISFCYFELARTKN